MKLSYKILGNYITEVNIRNSDLRVRELLGISIDKFFMPSVANVIGTDLSVYKIVKFNQFSCNRMHVGRDYRLPLSISKSEAEFIVSPAYDVFEIVDTNILDPDYLMMWFLRSEFDRNAWFYTDADVRGGLHWNAFCEMKLPIPTINKQREIVAEYNIIRSRISLNKKLIDNLEEITRAVFKQWFVDFEFPDENGLPYKSSGGSMTWNEELEQEIPSKWKLGVLGDCIEFFNGYAFESDELLDEDVGDCFAIFKMGNINKGGGLKVEGTKSWIKKKDCLNLERFIIKKGDLLMCMTDMKDKIGLLGSTALMTIDDKFILNQRVGLLRAKNNYGISYRHLYLLTNSTPFLQDLRSRANRGVQVNLTSGEIIGTKLLIPDYETNIAFDNIIRGVFLSIDSYVIDAQVCQKISTVLLSKMAVIKN